MAREAGNTWVVVQAQTTLGLLAAQEGRPNEALELCRQALEVAQPLGFLHNIAYGLHVLTVAAAAQGRLERAARLWAPPERCTRRWASQCPAPNTTSSTAM